MATQPASSFVPAWIGGLAAAALLAPIITYYGLLAGTTVNVPYLDDYDTILAYLLADRVAATPMDRLDLLFETHVEHRIALVRGAALVSHAATGAVDFRWLAWLGNLGLVALTAGLFGVFRRHDTTTNRLLLFAPVGFLLFQPQFWDAWFWATSSLSNLWVLPMALVTFMALDRGTPLALLLASGLGIITVLTQANGLLVLPVGCGVLLLGRKPRPALAWAVFGTAVALLYTLNLERPPGSRTIGESLASLIPILHYAINFLGAATGFGNSIASFVAGIFIGFSALFLCARQGRRNPPLYGLFLLLLASALLNAFAREHIRGSDYALDTWRYRSYASAALAVTYLAWAESAWTLRHRQAWVSIALAVGIAFNTLSYVSYASKAQSVATQLERGLANWQNTGRGLRHPHPTRSNEILAAAVREGLYQPPTHPR